MDHSKADPGLLMALELDNLPSGQALEFGFGSASNLFAMSKIFPGAVGLELNRGFIEDAESKISSQKIEAKVVQRDVWKEEICKDTLSVVAVGMTIYAPKSMVKELLEKVWQGLKTGGILHVSFSTIRDSVLQDEFVEYTCKPFPEEGYENSFNHFCGIDVNCWMVHPGVLGASFWEESEAAELIKSLGPCKIIYEVTDEWEQHLSDGNGNVEELFRSFYRITVQKL